MRINPQTVTLDANMRAALRPAIEARQKIIAARLASIAEHFDSAKGGERSRAVWHMERNALETQAARLSDFLASFID